MERLKFGRPFLTGLPVRFGNLSVLSKTKVVVLSEWDQETIAYVIFPSYAYTEKELRGHKETWGLNGFLLRAGRNITWDGDLEVLCLQEGFCLFSFLVTATWTPFLLR